MYCIIDYFKGRLLVIMVYSTVAVEDGHAFLFCSFTVTPIHTVIRPVVPLAGKDKKTLWKEKNNAQKHTVTDDKPCASVAIAQRT